MHPKTRARRWPVDGKSSLYRSDAQPAKSEEILGITVSYPLIKLYKSCATVSDQGVEQRYRHERERDANH
jgi:hypothetical protein